MRCPAGFEYTSSPCIPFRIQTEMTLSMDTKGSRPLGTGCSTTQPHDPNALEPSDMSYSAMPHHAGTGVHRTAGLVQHDLDFYMGALTINSHAARQFFGSFRKGVDKAPIRPQSITPRHSNDARGMRFS